MLITKSVKKYQMIVGQKIGRLTVLEYLGTENKQYYYKCSCECGNENVIKSYGYLTGSVNLKSCGCWNREHTILFNKETKTGFNNQFFQDENRDYHIMCTKINKEYEVIVNEDMFEFLTQINRKLQIDCRGYAFISKEDTNGKQLFIHNLVIFGIDYYNKNMNILVDHIDSNNIRDNRKCNLRPANDSENSFNRKRSINNSSGIKGFSIKKSKDMYKIQIRVRIGKNYNRICKTFDLSPFGLKEAILWNLNTRKELHEDFTNYGFDIKNKTIEDIINEQSKILIDNLSDDDRYYFYNQIRIDREPKKK